MLKGLRGVWLGRGIGLLGDLEIGWWAFLSLVSFSGFVIPPNLTFHVIFLRCRFVYQLSISCGRPFGCYFHIHATNH